MVYTWPCVEKKTDKKFRKRIQQLERNFEVRRGMSVQETEHRATRCVERKLQRHDHCHGQKWLKRAATKGNLYYLIFVYLIKNISCFLFVLIVMKVTHYYIERSCPIFRFQKGVQNSRRYKYKGGAMFVLLSDKWPIIVETGHAQFFSPNNVSIFYEIAT